MTLKDIFQRKKSPPETAPDDADTVYPIPNARELEAFRKDAAEGRIEKVQAFIDKYSGDYADDTGKYGWSPLKLSVWRGHAETADLLRTAQARVLQ